MRSSIGKAFEKLARKYSNKKYKRFAKSYKLSKLLNRQVKPKGGKVQ